MDFMEQCQAWNENDEYQMIVDAIEALPGEARTPELDSELGRAYNNLAGVEDRELYEKAIAVLKPHEEYFAKDHNWNFRMAFAYYYLDQEGPALRYFQQALEARPGDEDTQAFIDDCRRRLLLPRFRKNFRERTAEAWAAFEAGEAGLRELLDRKDQDEAAAELVAKCSAILSTALENPAFELGFNGEKYELILTPEGDRVKLFELVYFRRQAPAEVLERWNILVGRQSFRGGALRIYGQEISAADVRFRAEPKGEGDKPTGVELTLYCGKLLPMLREREQHAWLLLSILTDQVLGEIPAMAVIEDFQVADAPLEGPDMALTQLPGALEQMGLSLNSDAAAFLENGYTAYRMEPNKDPDADWRLDVYAGSTRCPALVSEYLHGESGAMDSLHADGAVAGFFCYPLDGFTGGDRAAAVLDFRDALEAAVRERAGAQCVTFLGGASGVYCGYLDFIAWDLPAVLDAAAEFFAAAPLAWASFHTFRRNVGPLRRLNREEQG